VPNPTPLLPPLFVGAVGAGVPSTLWVSRLKLLARLMLAKPDATGTMAFCLFMAVLGRVGGRWNVAQPGGDFSRPQESRMYVAIFTSWSPGFRVPTRNGGFNALLSRSTATAP